MLRTDVRLRALAAGAACIGAFAAAAPSASAQETAAERPNIIVILADDLGFSDIGSYGGEIETPQLDRLAAQGLRFTQFYNTARCSPTRAALLTGLYSHQAGMGHMPDGYATYIRETFGAPAYTDHLAPTTPTIAEVLRGAGYATYMTGKWHVGYERSQWPASRGFDRSLAIVGGAANYYGWGVQNGGNMGTVEMAMDGEPYEPPREGFFTTDAFSDQAARYIREHDAGKPFFLYLAYNAPHWPLHAPEEDVAEYRGSYLAKGWDRIREERYQRLTEMGIIDAGWPLAPRPEEVPAWESAPAEARERWDHEMAIYAAQVERMDAGIGRVMQALADRGMSENTLVVFLADNGGAAEDPNQSLEGAALGGPDSYEGYGIRGAHVSSAPFRLTKKWVHEGGIAAPLIVHWPAGFSARGSLRSDPAHVIDLMPTILDVAAVEFPDSFDGHVSTPPEGTSLVPAFRGADLPDRAIFWEHEGNRAIRQGRWKLVSRFPGSWELYDMAADRTELNDLSARHPDRVQEMAQAWEAWAGRVGARPWSLVATREVGPRLPAHRESAPAEIDGVVEFTQSAPWTPLLRVDWGNSEATAEGWMRAGWTPRGVHLAFLLPHAAATDRMPTGRTPDAPFVLHVELGGGEGDYEIRCVPLVEPVSRMTQRHPAYLFNHRLGANARVGESGHALCHEVSLLGILADSLETRWQAAPGGGLAFEALVPWATLRRSAPAASTYGIPFRVRIDRPGERVAEWGGEESPGRLRLIPEALPTDEDFVTMPPHLAASVVRQPAPLEVGVARVAGGSAGGVVFELVNGEQQVVGQAAGREAGDAWMAQVDTGELPDGSYLLRVRSGDRIVGDRRIALVAGRAEQEVIAPAERLSERLSALAAAAQPAWMTGHIARAREALRLAELPRRLDAGRLEEAHRLVITAEAIVAALEAGRRPAVAEDYRHPAGFAADGAHGPVEFVPTTNPTARLTVHAAAETDWSLTPRLYGTFSEPVVYDRPIYGWLYAQALRNPSLEFGHPSVDETVEAHIGYRELEPEAARAALAGGWLPRLPTTIEEVAAPWFGVGRGSARFGTECPGAFNDQQCQRIEAPEGARDVGIAQIVSLPAWRATHYQLRGFLRSEGGVESARAVLYHQGRPISTAPLSGVGPEWRAFEADLEAPVIEGPLSTFVVAILFDGPGRLDIDLVTLFPADTVAAGFDPQAVAQLRDLKTGWIRWPGGNLASGYHWRDGVGPRNERPSLPNPSWPGLSSNFVGTNEYLRLSELVGTEPLITVNAGDGTAEEAARWVEYVNGDTTTEMGRLRARHGHPEPYGVRYWNIGNELWGHWQVGYTSPEKHARRYAEFARAMRAVDPSIRLVANGHGGHSESPPEPWNEPLLENYGDELDIIDVHTYVGVPDEPGLSAEDRAFLLSAIPLSYERWLADFRADLVRRGLEEARVIVGEYNGSMRSDSREVDRLGSLLIYAGYLHAFMRQGEYLVGANATEYSPFNPRALPFDRMHPRYDLFRTYATLAGTQPIEATLETPVVQQPRKVGRDVVPIFNLPLVDAVALKDPSDGSLGISLINRDMEEAIEVEVKLEDFEAAAEARWFFFGGSAVREETLSAGDSFTVTLPPHSVSLLKIPPRPN